MRIIALKKCETNVTMLTEEQIKRLVKKLADEHGFDEENSKKYLLFIESFSESALVLLPEDKKELFNKIFEGPFVEALILRYFRIENEICKIAWMLSLKKKLAQISFEKEESQSDPSRDSDGYPLRGVDVVP